MVAEGDSGSSRRTVGGDGGGSCGSLLKGRKQLVGRRKQTLKNSKENEETPRTSIKVVGLY